MRAYFDTNVFVYAVGRGDRRQPIAIDLIDQHPDSVVNVQVLNEFTSVLRKPRFGWDYDLIDALRTVTILGLVGQVVPVTLDDHRAAFELSRAYNLNIYDGVHVASALKAGCDVMFTEDLQHGRRFGALEIVNPFS